MRPHFFFQKGEDKLQDELDVVTLVRSIRQIRLVTQAIMSQRQKLMLKFQRKNLIESGTSSSDDDHFKYDTLRLMEQPNPIIKLTVLGRMKKMITSYKNADLHDIDKKLIRGVYMRNLKDF